MPPQPRSRSAEPVPSAARSTKLIDPAQSALRAIPLSGASPDRPIRLWLSDQQLREQVLVQVSKFGQQITRHVSLDVRHGEVTLLGAVSSDYERSLIEQAVRRLAGVQHLSNEIRVRDNPPVQGPSTSQGIGRLERLWKLAAITGVLVVVAASLLLMFQVASAAADEPLSLDSVRASATECCLSLEMRR